MGYRNKRKPNPKFEKVPILFGLGAAGLLLILTIIAAVYFS
jgi:hypothetical protein